jgi:hypothetical protein
LNVETEEQSKQWMHTHSPNRPKKFKQTLSACQKADENCFWGEDRKRVLMVEFMQQGTTITSEVYCETQKKLCRAIQKKRLTSGVLVHLLYDNANAYTAASTRALLEHFN